MSVFKVKWEKMLELAIKRLFLAEKAIKEWQKHGGGNMEVFTFLALEGNEKHKIPPHPITLLNESNKKLWIKAFGEPIKIPKKLLISVSMANFLGELKKRRDLYRECVGFTHKSRFRNKYKR